MASSAGSCGDSVTSCWNEEIEGLGQGLDRGREVRLLADRRRQLDPAQPEHRELHSSVRQLEHVLDADHGADVVEVVEGHLFGVLVELRGDRDVSIP